MSRESDSSSPGPQGRGGAAYPSGTPPYGTRHASSDGGGSEEPAVSPKPEETRTETTLTTRIRINIPGSRPIPPVIMRTPVGDEAAAGDDAPAAPGAPAAAGPAVGERKPALPRRPEPSAAPARAEAERQSGTGEKEKASDWFAPRKSGPSAPGPSTGANRRAGTQGGTVGGASAGGTGAAGGVPGGPAGVGGPSNGAPGGFGGGSASGGVPGAGAPLQTPMTGAQNPSTTAATPWPADPMATGANPVMQEPPAVAAPVDDWPLDPSTTSATPWQNGAPAAPVDDWPGGSQTTGATPWQGAGQVAPAPAPADDWPLDASGGGAAPWQGNASAARAARRSGSQVDDWPGGSSTTGAVPQQPTQGGAVGGAAPWPGGAPGDASTTSSTPWPADPATTGATPWPADPMATGAPGASPAAGAAPWNEAVESTQQFPAPTMGQGAGAAPFAPAPPGGGAFTEGRTDTPREGFPRVPGPATGAQAAPQAPVDTKAPKQPKGGKGAGKKGGPKVPPPAGQKAAGETLVSGVPVVPPPAGPGAKAAPVDSGAPRVPVPKPKVPAPGATAPAAKSAPAKAAPAKSAPKKKGRSKLVLAGGALVALVGVAYGAGLLLDHADVPNGTTVLGVAIGGSSKEQAVQKLDSALGDRATAPLKVSIGGKQATLKPSVAGLSIDTQATVRDAAGRDYNPLTVIGSLVGGTRTAEPSIGADEEKIADALKRASGETGTAREGTIKFEPGKAVPVYGQAYQGLDTDKAVAAVAQAYRDRAATGQDKTVELPSAGQQPKVDKAEVDREMESFAKPAMSGLVTVQTDATHKIQFGPERSLPKILSVKEVNGKLVDAYDLEAIKELYGTTFAGVKIQRGDGSKTDVTPQDVVGALRKALMGKTPAERTGVIPLNPS
ncbi:hypothetical protein GCM10010319_63770 [Streptomyces blastmyceticus]|uniref:Peptidoglycan binding domain-containing protein n=1 Tax=Streptomyces blastmyceticus TaxID=68180 RepID=A0ABN0XY32_9ACTN